MDFYKIIVVCDGDRKGDSPLEVSYLLTEAPVMQVYREAGGNKIEKILVDGKTNSWDIGKRVELILTKLSQEETKKLLSKIRP